ncbi:MAG: glucose-6-phosphate isomerase [Clostridia bacterium]|nr:glucose-6-phosphate isomerase [Deltaproteobacteria bacterium]
MISVSIDGLFAPVLERGLSRDALAKLAPQLKTAHRELMSRRGGEIGFYDLPRRNDLVKLVTNEVSRLRSICDELVVLGIGGSSMGGQALSMSLRHTVDRPSRVHFVDNIDPDTIGVLLGNLDPASTSVVVISKSGVTTETMAQLLVMRRWLRVTLGAGETRSRMTFITQKGRGLLHDVAQSEGVRTIEIPENVGGRYSVLTPVGLLPAAFMGVDIVGVMQGAAEMVERVVSDDIYVNPGIQLAAGALLADRELGRRSLVMMPYADALQKVTSWFVQLWAESLGKRIDRHGQIVNSGQTPLPALGVTDQHAQLQLFLEGPPDKAVMLVQAKKFKRALPVPDELSDREEVAFLGGRDLSEVLAAELRATRAMLLDAGVPVIDVGLGIVDAAHVGGLFVLLEAACACTGLVMGINPFDEPGIEAGKRMAAGLLGCPGYERDADRVLMREARKDRLS